MKPENYIKRHFLKHGDDAGPFTSVICYSLVYIKRHKTLYFFDVIFDEDTNDFQIKIINKSSKKTLDEQLKDMFIFSKDLDPKYDYQTIELIDKTKYTSNKKDFGNINLAYIRYNKNENFKLCDISNNLKGEIKKI
jgi:hypothetical protein